MQRLTNKVAIVTGAGANIGEACAKMLAAQGAKVVVADINSDGAARVAREIVTAGGDAIAHPVDGVAFAAQVDRIPADAWDGPGLGEWDLRALVGHASRSLVTVLTYLPIERGDVVCDCTETLGLVGGSGCGLNAWAVLEASPKQISVKPPDSRAVPATFLMALVIMVSPSRWFGNGETPPLADSWQIPAAGGYRPPSAVCQHGKSRS